MRNRVPFSILVGACVICVEIFWRICWCFLSNLDPRLKRTGSYKFGVVMVRQLVSEWVSQWVSQLTYILEMAPTDFIIFFMKIGDHNRKTIASPFFLQKFLFVVNSPPPFMLSLFCCCPSLCFIIYCLRCVLVCRQIIITCYL